MGATPATAVLRGDLLAEVTVVVACVPRGGDGFADAVSQACADAGARVTRWRVPATPGADPPVIGAEVLVNDCAGFHAQALRDSGGTDAGLVALRACLDTTWRATRTLSAASPVQGAGGAQAAEATQDAAAADAACARARRVISVAPREGAGAHADAARAALENLSRTLSIEWARHQITAVTIAPGARTAPHDVGALVAYLASPAGAYFSGCQFDLRAPAHTHPGGC